jgi:hypothetical protein
MVSRIPGTLGFTGANEDLIGHFPLTTTFVSRLLQILAETDEDSDYARKAVHGLLEQSRISLGSDHSHRQVLHHFRFSIEYLLRQKLLHPTTGDSVALAGLVSHLYYTEPANFALAELLRYGVFHRVCRDFNPAKPSPAIFEAMMHILANLFGRRIRKNADQEMMETVIKRSPSKIILEPLPEDARNVLVKHNTEIVEIYRSYSIRYGRAMFDSTEKALPLSAMAFGASARGKSGLVERMHTTAIVYSARGGFIATSGHGDSFDTVVDLAHNTREGILIEAAAVPSMDDFIDPPILDAYLLDFYKHGQVDALVNGNGVRRGEVWYVLDSFDRILGAISESLRLVAHGVEVDFAGDEMAKYAANKSDSNHATWELEEDWQGEGNVEGDLDAGDRRVCDAFSILRTEFRAKFMKMWA